MPNDVRTWHDDAFVGLHYDLHAKAGDTLLGAELTAEHLRERLLRVKPDWIQCDCKGHEGYTSWPTRTGSTSPGVVKDSLRIHRDVTKELGIRLGMHYSGVYDSRAIELHPDWGRIDAAGARDDRYTCRLSGYTEQLMIPQMLEVIDEYDVDGFWVDGDNWAARPCWCDRCTAEFTRRTGLVEIPRSPQDPNWEAWLVFHRELFVEHVRAYADAVHRRKPQCLVCSNWMYTIRQPDPIAAPVDYLSGDYDWRWGADRADVEGRLLDGRGMSWDLMAWSFGAGEDLPWVAKPLASFCQEVAVVVALGGAVMFYDTPQRSGWLTGWRQDLLGRTAEFCRARKQMCFGSLTASDAAILHHAPHFYSCNDPLFNYGQAVRPLEGALHAMIETHRSVDILMTADAPDRMSRYKLIVVPEQTRLGDSMCAALEAFARAGGYVLMTGSHLAAECPGLVGASLDGSGKTSADEPPGFETVYLPVGDEAVPVSGVWPAVRPHEGTAVPAYQLRQQEPAKDRTDRPAVTKRTVGQGAIIAIHGPIFHDYFLGHYPLLLRFLANLVDGLGVDWTAWLEAPTWVEMILRRQDGRLCVNLINRAGGRMTNDRRTMNEEIPPAADVIVHVRSAGPPRSVRLVPSNQPVPWSYADGVTTARIPKVEIHEVLTME